MLNTPAQSTHLYVKLTTNALLSYMVTHWAAVTDREPQLNTQLAHIQ